MCVSHLVELPQVLLLCLVDDGQDPGDGLADDAAEKRKPVSERVRRVLNLLTSLVPEHCVP